MAFRRSFRSGSFVRRNKRKRLYKRKPVVRKSMRKAVRRQVTRMAETKSQVFGQLVDLYQVNSSLYKNENVIPVTPYSGFLTIQQGVSEGQRLGNKVNMKSVRLRLGIWPKQYDATTNPNPRPCMVRCWLVSMKTGVGATKDYMTDIVQSYFLQGTTGSNAGLSGVYNDLISPSTMIFLLFIRLGHGKLVGLVIGSVLLPILNLPIQICLAITIFQAL